MEKFLRVEMSDGSTYDVPLEVIARSRANYFSKQEADQESMNAVYHAELEYTMNDHEEAIDWATNNMNWDDVRNYAVKLEEPKVIDLQNGWVNGQKQIVSK
ncbi:hypothetical protein P4V33_09380 [Brevibacillus borstelensis]|uniref:hypothetical protein n=1 Tax=Brevibacillus borstelensis TaxID=45462 RepID=UPI002E219A21|nr:hypothetical protein [Brevibacillus borstelensis]